LELLSEIAKFTETSIMFSLMWNWGKGAYEGKKEVIFRYVEGE
jgi:hypothetical protein